MIVSGLHPPKAVLINISLGSKGLQPSSCLPVPQFVLALVPNAALVFRSSAVCMCTTDIEDRRSGNRRMMKLLEGWWRCVRKVMKVYYALVQTGIDLLYELSSFDCIFKMTEFLLRYFTLQYYPSTIVFNLWYLAVFCDRKRTLSSCIIGYLCWIHNPISVCAIHLKVSSFRWS